MGLLDAAVEFHQQLAGPHVCPGLESDLFDRARHLGAEHDTLNRGDRADGRQRRLPSLLRHFGGGNRLRRWREIGPLREHGLKLQDLEAGERSHQQQYANQGEDDFLGHTQGCP